MYTNVLFLAAIFYANFFILMFENRGCEGKPTFHHLWTDRCRHLPGIIRIPSRKFNDPSVILQMLPENGISVTISKGIKENVLFVLGNEGTTTRLAYEQWSCTDCGPWPGRSGKIHHLVSESNGHDCVDKKRRNVFVCEPLPVNVIVL